MSQSGWYHVSNGQRLGPLAFEQLRHLAAAGQIFPDALVWTEGMPDWQPASVIPGLFPAPPAYGYAQPQQAAQPYDALDALAAAAHDPYAQTNADPGRYYPQPGGPLPYHRPGRRVGASQNGMAIAGFVLAFVFPLLGLIFSWVALSGMKANNNPEGKGMATAGLVLSSVFVGISCLWVIAVFTCMGAGMQHRY